MEAGQETVSHMGAPPQTVGGGGNRMGEAPGGPPANSPIMQGAGQQPSQSQQHLDPTGVMAASNRGVIMPPQLAQMSHIHLMAGHHQQAPTMYPLKARLECYACNKLLEYDSGAQYVQCFSCSTMNSAQQGSQIGGRVLSMLCPICHTTNLAPYGVNYVRCGTCHTISQVTHAYSNAPPVPDQRQYVTMPGMGDGDQQSSQQPGQQMLHSAAPPPGASSNNSNLSSMGGGGSSSVGQQQADNNSGTNSGNNNNPVVIPSSRDSNNPGNNNFSEQQ